MEKFLDNWVHLMALGFGLAFLIKGFIPLSKIVVSSAPIPTSVKTAYNA